MNWPLLSSFHLFVKYIEAKKIESGNLCESKQLTKLQRIERKQKDVIHIEHYRGEESVWFNKLNSWPKL